MNSVITALIALLKLGANFLPEALRGTVKLVLGLLGHLNLPEGDPRAQRVAELVADLAEDVSEAMKIEDASAREAARLALEHKFLRAWVGLMPGGVK